MSRGVADRFNDKYIPVTESGCWIWIAADKGNGYGNFQHEGKYIPAHRMSYMLHHNIQISGDIDVCHICDVSQCVNPDHLFLGTRKDNMMDAVKKNRQATGFKLPQTKLSESDVDNIIKSSDSAEAIASKYNVSKTYIQRIKKHGKRY